MKWNRCGDIRRLVVVLTVAVAAIVLAANTGWAAKNVILMIADGSGHNTWLAASMYQGTLGKQTFDQPGWQRFACSTYPLNLSEKPTGDTTQDSSVIYDPRKAWDTAPSDPGRVGFAGYEYLTTTATDSAAAATAMATGRKTYNHAINWTNDGLPLRGQTIAEIAKAHGRSTGVVTTVQWSDATPAGLGGAHNVARGNHAQIANEMLDGDWLDVIMGTGNPDYDNDGQALAARQTHDYQWVGGRANWQSLKQGRRGWKLIESQADFAAIASGPTPPKVVGVAHIAKTLQEKRARNQTTSATSGTSAEPFAIPFNRNVPTLATMTKAAINCLDDNPKGFYLMIEGGAVDWANHDNKPARMIEEQVDFVRAVEAVADWVNKHSSWDDTLLILTADHECGLLWGPKSDVAAFDPIRDNGPGRLPGMKYNSRYHSNSLVPLYARGPGSQRFAELVKGTDAKAAAVWHFSGKYVDNTDIFTVMKAEMDK
jgi:alkaline phosphatase